MKSWISVFVHSIVNIERKRKNPKRSGLLVVTVLEDRIYSMSIYEQFTLDK